MSVYIAILARIGAALSFEWQSPGFVIDQARDAAYDGPSSFVCWLARSAG